MVGFLLLNKSKGISSAFCVGYIKKIINKKVKIGHAGTLDPFATGLLIIAIGRQATKQLPQIMKLKKTYYATAVLGELTDTLDYTGALVEYSSFVITEQAMCAALYSFGDSYEQIPPLYSACKYQGEPLYKLARQRIVTNDELLAIAQQKRKIVHLYELELISFAYPSFTVKATVSQGTYIRTLLNDIAERSGTFATTYELERTAIGNFDIRSARCLADFATVEDVEKHLLSSLDFF